jgi:hypothetical protein
MVQCHRFSLFPPVTNEKLFSDMGLKGIAAVCLTIAAGIQIFSACARFFVQAEE